MYGGSVNVRLEGDTLRTTDGTTLHVVESGERSAGTTVVLLHGWTLDHTSWARVATALPETCAEPVRVVRYDHRGHGSSDPAPSGTATIGQVADDLAELLADRVPTGPVVLAGHSMGGMTVMALAERHPELFAERVAGVAFVATSSGGLSRPTFGLPGPLAGAVRFGEATVNRRLARLTRGTLSGRPSLLAPGLRWLLFGQDAGWADVADTAAQVARCHPASMAGFRVSLGEHERREALAAARDLPSVVLAGGADRLCPLPHARKIAAELPGAEFAIYPGAGHMLPLERCTEVTEWIARLVRAVAAGSSSSKEAG